MSQKLNEIKVPDSYYDRHTFGVQVLDEIFGGQDSPGMMTVGSYLCTGMPGAGKSTMWLQLADLLESNGIDVLYNLGEENRFMVKMRADRLRLKSEFFVSDIEDVDELIALRRELDVPVLVQDSIQTLRYGDLRGARLLKKVAKKLDDAKKEEGFTVIAIGHITKGGNFAGPQEIKHIMDAHAHLRFNPDTGNRIFEFQKNRFGPAMIPYEFGLSAAGMDFEQVIRLNEDEETEKKTTKSSERREKLLEFAVEKLLDGDKLSGYCHDRFGLDCSGGFWRAVVAKAAHRLRSEGHVIGEEKIGGRTYTFVEI